MGLTFTNHTEASQLPCSPAVHRGHEDGVCEGRRGPGFFKRCQLLGRGGVSGWARTNHLLGWKLSSGQKGSKGTAVPETSSCPKWLQGHSADCRCHVRDGGQMPFVPIVRSSA